MRIKIYPPLAIQELGSRGNQEDFIFPEQGQATEGDALFIVCDGMGGHENGEVASQTFATALAEYFRANATSDEVLDDKVLNKAIQHAYDRLDAKDSGGYKKMGTTLTLLYLHRGGVTAAHIGDSRIYHLRPGERLLYVSRDHSLVYDLYQSGEISYGEMKTSKQKNVITRAVQPGEDNRVKPDIIHITDIKPGDYFYMCSDGMLEQMDDDELFTLLSGKGSDNKKLRQLIAATSENDDNHSAYLIHIESVTHEPDDNLNAVNEEVTARCNALNIKVIKDDQKAIDQDDMDDATQLAPATKPSVTRPRRPKKKTWTWLWWAILIAAIVAAAVWLTLYGLQDNHKHSNALPATELNDTQVGNSTTPPAIHRKAVAEHVKATTRHPKDHSIDHSKDKKVQPIEMPKKRPAAVKATDSTSSTKGPKLPSIIKSRLNKAGVTSSQQATDNDERDK